METYYIVVPHCHGNGGWCGSSVEAEYPTEDEALHHHPNYETNDWENNAPRICLDKNPNNALYIWNNVEYIWEKQEVKKKKVPYKFGTQKFPILREIDLSKGNGCNHTDIKADGTKYFVKHNGRYYYGSFNNPWYGLNFIGIYDAGAQYDTPGTNHSLWEAVWEIVEKDTAIEMVKSYLTGIANIGGNLSDKELCSRTGANDAVSRGIKIVAARELAKAGLDILK